jgi:uracil-DNA glycosylase
MKRLAPAEPGLFPEPRISGKQVAAFFPEEGGIHAIVFGEAPGPRGADRSGIPFWGDGAGIPLYRALKQAGCADFPEQVWDVWEGGQLIRLGFRPRLRGVALSNAFANCPSDDGHRFRAPKKSEWASLENQKRLSGELELAARRGCERIVTLGRCAAQALRELAAQKGWTLVALPHPSSQGLLMDAPGKGRGMRLADLQVAWQKRLEFAVREVVDRVPLTPG